MIGRYYLGTNFEKITEPNYFCSKFWEIFFNFFMFSKERRRSCTWMEAALLPSGGVLFREGVVLIELILLCLGVGTGLNHRCYGID